MMKSILLGFGVSAGVVAFALVGILTLDRFLPTFTDGFSLLTFPAAALAATLFLKRHHPQISVLTTIAYFVVVMLVTAYVTLFIAAQRSGVEF